MTRTQPGGPPLGTVLIVLVVVGLLMAVSAGAAAAAAYSFYTRDLPSPDRLENRQVFRSTKIYDRNDNLLFEIFDPQAGKRTSVKLSDISPYLVKATIAIEDASFYDNPGVSWRGIARAAVSNLQGEEIQGGSTITQQLIKKVLLTDEVSIQRKIQEAILAYRVSQLYTKDQILEWYLNEIFYGNMAYGIEAAAQSYLGKSSKDLDLAESAMLAGLPQSPALLSPLVDPAAAKRRQRMVLDAMVRTGDITEEEAEAAARQEIHYQPARYDIKAPHFVMHVRELLERKYGPKMLYSGGLVVHTSLDLSLQEKAEAVAREQVAKLEKSNIHNAALVALRPNTGEILAMVGSVDYFDQSISGQVNIATSDRQPGSTFKPITYSAAFQKGWGPGTVLLDDYTVFQDRNKQPYAPKNVDKKYHGPVTIRTALANSMNIPAVKTIQFVGVDDTLAQAHLLGINSLPPNGSYDLSLTLGTGEVRLLDLAYVYSVFANGGWMYGQPVPQEVQRQGFRKVDPVAILKVEDASGKILEEFTGPQRVEVLKPEIAYQITSILSDNLARSMLFGLDNPLKLSRPAAAKTGTTEENTDLWTVGYTPDLVAGVWVGNSDNKPIAQVLTTMSAAPIWHNLMESDEARKYGSGANFEQPSGLERVEICPLDGLRPNKYCPAKTTELFVKGTAPTKECNIHRLVTIDKTTGNLATASTAPENREEKVVEVYPPEWASWARAAGKPEAPGPPAAESSTPAARPAENRDANSALVVNSPATGAAVRDLVEIRGTASGKAFASYKVEYGEGAVPTVWKPIGGAHPTPVENGILERWDARSLNGLYRLRVTLTERPAALVPPAPVPGPTVVPGAPAPAPTPPPTPAPPVTKVVEIPVIVDNVAPTVAITFPADNANLRKDQMERIVMAAQVSDNHLVARTDFYVDDRMVGSSTATPATLEWPSAPGFHVLRAITRDVAGNEARSADVKITVR